MNVRRATSLIRKDQWMKIISERNASGLTVKEYCFQHNLNQGSYYYWLKKIRKGVLEENSTHEEPINTLVPMMKTLSDQETPNDNDTTSYSKNCSLSITTNVMRVEFDSNASSDLVLQVIRELKHA
ncbi:hypothetical protein EZV73_27895 [Acidaminobacter sp. JC074]|uniref:IS66 family insertion sequence element accessory protein TnpA n=1 Tax=Acidaminobacter sp. JC074 TaxID=2530199 RepID=UPI001F106584|nr:hypothetical protein [Acidaminobacter sp. JC074]MCH4891424.1 hypothetical protein [Acidaminobacter sp. JC074]